MGELSSLDKVQGRRFMIRVDLPDQGGAWDGLKAQTLLDDMLGKWSYVGQVERGGKNQRLHFQVYLESPTPSPIRMGSIVRAIRRKTDVGDRKVSEYISKAKYSAAHCVRYCTKSDTRVWGPWSNRPMESWPESEDGQAKVSRSDLYNAVMNDGIGMADILSDPDLAVASSSCVRWLADLIRQREASKWGRDGMERDVQVVYLYGPSNTGKSTIARQWLRQKVGENGFFTVSDFERDPWGDYASQGGVLFDDLRLPAPKLGWQDFIRMFDRFPFRLSRRYSNAWAAFSFVVITSNWSPSKQWEALKWGGPLSAQPTDDDRQAFMRRLTRILHVHADGSITDESAEYHEGVDGRSKASLDELNSVLLKPVSPAVVEPIPVQDMFDIQ